MLQKSTLATCVFRHLSTSETWLGSHFAIRILGQYPIHHTHHKYSLDSPLITPWYQSLVRDWLIHRAIAPAEAILPVLWPERRRMNLLVPVGQRGTTLPRTAVDQVGTWPTCPLP
jgi:hypothetical protein